MKKNNKVNYGKIKRDILKRDTKLDSRYTTKVVKSDKAYKRKKFNQNDLDNESE